MPLPADEFDRLAEHESGVDPDADTNASRLLRYLRDHPHRAFRRGELAEATGIPPGSVGSALARLSDRGLVEHRGRYWRIAEAATDGTDALRHADATADARDGGFDAAEIEVWMRTAEEPVDGWNEGADGDGRTDA